jgi:threonine dehydratase
MSTTILVDTDGLCAAMKDVFETRAIVEPSAALGVVGPAVRRAGVRDSAWSRCSAARA